MDARAMRAAFEAERAARRAEDASQEDATFYSHDDARFVPKALKVTIREYAPMVQRKDSSKRAKGTGHRKYPVRVRIGTGFATLNPSQVRDKVLERRLVELDKTLFERRPYHPSRIALIG